VIISFGGSQRNGDVLDSVTATIDRVTGDVSAETMIFVGSVSAMTKNYMLKCIPAQPQVLM
jgi:hypothetical protein